MQPTPRPEQDRYAVILAGGDATRLMPLSRRITGRSVPKQFCPIVGDASLLQQTRDRVALASSAKRTILVLTSHHEEFYKGQVSDHPASNLVIQPSNRGTAPAIFYALLRLTKVNPYAVVAVFPSDHYVDDERRFLSHVEVAMQAARLRPAQAVLLGIRPDRAEPGFGWIEPSEQLERGSKLLRVARFWEKPLPLLAQRLWKRGCLWNSFVMASTLRAFLTMMARALPDLKRAFASARLQLGTSDERTAIERVYAKMPCRDFSRDVLARNAQGLVVLPVEGVYWNDLGDPRRVHRTLAQAQLRPNWLKRRAGGAMNNPARQVTMRRRLIGE